MYGIYANIWGIFMANVTIYTIHGSYGIEKTVPHVQKTKKFTKIEKRQLCFKKTAQLTVVMSKSALTICPIRLYRFGNPLVNYPYYHHFLWVV